MGDAINDNMGEKICFLHIGKTGGTYIKSILKKQAGQDNRLFVGEHIDTLSSTKSTYGADRKLAFTFRNPKLRFVSGFNSRLRQGRPTYNVNWSEGEAIAFSYFATPNHLAEALYAKDERQKSAARYAISQVLHLKTGYTHYLTSPDLMDQEMAAGNILLCCETSKIDNNIGKIFRALGLEDVEIRDGNRNTAPDSASQIMSPLAVENIEEYWKDEFEIYQHCLKCAGELGFD